MWLIKESSLANAELHLTFARLFRRLELSLYETEEDDMDWMDCGVTVMKGHLKVRVKEVEA